MKTSVIHIRDMKSGDAYIGRTGNGEDGYFGNPHPVGYCELCKTKHARGEAVEAFRATFAARIETDEEYKQHVHNLHGKRLACFCHPAACHGDVIAAYLNNLNPIPCPRCGDTLHRQADDSLYCRACTFTER